MRARYAPGQGAGRAAGEWWNAEVRPGVDTPGGYGYPSASFFPGISDKPYRLTAACWRPALPNVKSAEKRMRTSERRNERNRQFRSKLRTAIKKVRSAESTDAGAEALKAAIVLIDRAAHKNIVHANKAARDKSRLSAFVKKLEQA
jgi:small subunit ribosomal protein S20